MMHMGCFTRPWVTRDKLKAVPISTLNLYWNNKCKYIRIHTVRDTLILHFQVLVRPRARVWKHIGAGNNRTLRPITASGKQQRWESENGLPDRRTGQEAEWPLKCQKMQEQGLQHPLGKLSSEHTEADGKHQHLHQLIIKREEAWWHNPSPQGGISLIPASSQIKCKD